MTIAIIIILIIVIAFSMGKLLRGVYKGNVPVSIVGQILSIYLVAAVVIYINVQWITMLGFIGLIPMCILLGMEIYSHMVKQIVLKRR